MPFDNTNFKSEEMSVLEQALAYLRDPSHWTQYTAKAGDRVCTVGAVNRYASFRQQRALNDRVVGLLFEAIPKRDLCGFSQGRSRRSQVQDHNDSISHDEVVAWFERTIASVTERDLRDAGRP